MLKAFPRRSADEAAGSTPTTGVGALPLAKMPAPSAAAIAADVRKPNRLVVAERALAAKRGERAEFVEKAKDDLAKSQENYGAARKIEARRLELEAEIVALRREVAPLRELHVAAVRQALAEEARTAAGEMLAALDALRAAQTRREAIIKALREAGDHQTTVPGLPRGLGEIERDARRSLAGEKS